MMRRIVLAGMFAATLFAAALGASISPATAACGGVAEQRLLPNGRFETATRQDCYPDLHSAPMTNTPRDTVDSSGRGCRNVQERVRQPNGKFHTRTVERCN